MFNIIFGIAKKKKKDQMSQGKYFGGVKWIYLDVKFQTLYIKINIVPEQTAKQEIL